MPLFDHLGDAGSEVLDLAPGTCLWLQNAWLGTGDCALLSLLPCCMLPVDLRGEDGSVVLTRPTLRMLLNDLRGEDGSFLLTRLPFCMLPDNLRGEAGSMSLTRLLLCMLLKDLWGEDGSFLPDLTAVLHAASRCTRRGRLSVADQAAVLLAAC